LFSSPSFFSRSRPHRALHSFPTRRSSDLRAFPGHPAGEGAHLVQGDVRCVAYAAFRRAARDGVLHAETGKDLHSSVVHGNGNVRSEEHTSELQSLTNLVCRLLLEKKKTNI